MAKHRQPEWSKPQNPKTPIQRAVYLALNKIWRSRRSSRAGKAVFKASLSSRLPLTKSSWTSKRGADLTIKSAPWRKALTLWRPRRGRYRITQRSWIESLNIGKFNETPLKIYIREPSADRNLRFYKNLNCNSHGTLMPTLTHARTSFSLRQNR